MTLLAFGMALVFCVLSLLHVAWAVGIQVGRGSAVPEREMGRRSFGPDRPRPLPWPDCSSWRRCSSPSASGSAAT